MAGNFLSGACSTRLFGMLYCWVDLHCAFAIKTVSKRNKERGKIKSNIKRVFCDLFMSNLWKGRMEMRDGLGEETSSFPSLLSLLSLEDSLP